MLREGILFSPFPIRLVKSLASVKSKPVFSQIALLPTFQPQFTLVLLCDTLSPPNSFAEVMGGAGILGFPSAAPCFLISFLCSQLPLQAAVPEGCHRQLTVSDPEGCLCPGVSFHLPRELCHHVSPSTYSFCFSFHFQNTFLHISSYMFL